MGSRRRRGRCGPRVRTDDVYVLEVREPLDLHERLTCDWREGDVW